ncbi:MAG: hypothetical protein IPJ71_19535 [Bdellovibrionales bacterium]|nr:hypothetical protein [Bdellovibrionales bacterium]
MLEELNFEESENWESNELLDDLEGECQEVFDHAEQICVKLRWMQCCFSVDHPSKLNPEKYMQSFRGD